MVFNPFTYPLTVRRSYVVLACMIAGAWGLLIFWQQSSYAELLGHESIGDHHISFTWQLAAFLISWSLMTVAMMLPINLLNLIQNRRGFRQLSLVVSGYLSPWVLFGLLAFLGDTRLHELADPGKPLAALSSFIAPAIILAAGFYQFTPFKRRSVEYCRPEMTTTPDFYEHKRALTAALQQGLRLGMYCVGSCWVLMLLMFALGHHRLEWMLVLGGVLAAERIARWGHRFSAVVGLILIIWATLLALSIIPGVL